MDLNRKYRLWNLVSNECELAMDDLASLLTEFANSDMHLTDSRVYQVYQQQLDGRYKVIMTIVGTNDPE